MEHSKQKKNSKTLKNPKVVGKKDEILEDLFPTAIRHKETGMEVLESLATEWAIHYPNFSVLKYMTEIKGYTIGDYQRLIKHYPVPRWQETRKSIAESITRNVLDKHISLATEVNEAFITGAKLSMGKAIEMLRAGRLEVTKVGGGTYIRNLKSIDLLNCTNALKTSQDVWRKALGINDNEGMVQLTQVFGQQNNLEVNIDETPEDLKKLEEKLSLEDIQTLIEARRDQIREEEVSDTTEVVDE